MDEQELVSRHNLYRLGTATQVRRKEEFTVYGVDGDCQVDTGKGVTKANEGDFIMTLEGHLTVLPKSYFERNFEIIDSYSDQKFVDDVDSKGERDVGTE